MKWLLFCLLALLTMQRNQVWVTNRTLWEDAESKAPCLVRPHANLAKAYEDQGLPLAQREEWRRVIELVFDHLCVAHPK